MDSRLVGIQLDARRNRGQEDRSRQEREAANEAFGPNGIPAIRLDAKNEIMARLHRIKTELDVTALRAEIESAGSPASAAAFDSSSDTPVTHIRRGRPGNSPRDTPMPRRKNFELFLPPIRQRRGARGLAEI